MYEHTQNFFKNREIRGTEIWENLKQNGKIEFVFAHPNGWAWYQQAFLRNAAVDGGLIHRDDASRMVHMITEGEASVHFMVLSGVHEHHLQVWSAIESHD